jgi:hypothetical protein
MGLSSKVMQKGRILIIDDNEDEHITSVHDIILYFRALKNKNNKYLKR